MDESDLIEACRRGDREAQRELYARSSPRIYALLLRMSRNADDAEELMQDTYVKVFQQIGSFAGQSRVETWIYQIALNEARQWLRRQRAQRDKLEKLHQMKDQAPTRPPGELRTDLDDLLEQLPEDEKTTLILRHHEGLSYAEIAERTGIPAGTVASRINRARRRLQGWLSDHSAEKK